MKRSEPVSRIYASTRIEGSSWFPYLESTCEKVGLTMIPGRLRRHRLDVEVASLSYRRLVIKENLALIGLTRKNPLVSKEMDRRNSLQFHKGKGKGSEQKFVAHKLTFGGSTSLECI